MKFEPLTFEKNIIEFFLEAAVNKKIVDESRVHVVASGLFQLSAYDLRKPLGRHDDEV